jgi:thiol-disulfide isomerase/thioredoxin
MLESAGLIMRYFIYVALFMIAFTLYSRSYCHLCDDMLEQLRAYTADYQFSVEVIDVDTDAELVHLYDELVPVLIGKSPVIHRKKFAIIFRSECFKGIFPGLICKKV